jgi:hypothetical protein
MNVIEQALRAIPGIDVRSVGGEDDVWFQVTCQTGLMVIARAIDNRYGGPPRDKPWHIKVVCCDTKPGYTYCLEGPVNDDWAKKIAKNIMETLQDDHVMQHYGVGAVGCLKTWDEVKGESR